MIDRDRTKPNVLKEPALHRSARQRATLATWYQSPLLLLTTVATSIFIIEGAVMLAFVFLPSIPRREQGLIDASVATLLLSPILYLLLFRPLILHITERKRAEEKLRESEERYRSLTNDVLDTSAVGMFILDPDFRVVWVNRSLERYFGFRRDEVIGKDKRQLIRQRIKDTFHDPESFAEKVLATYDNNTYVENFECHVLPAGEREERWLEHWSQPIRSGLYAGGRIEHYTDVTQRKQAEQALQESEARFRTLAQTTAAAIFIYRGTQILYANPAAETLCGYTREDWPAMNFWDLIHPDFRELARARGSARQRGEGVPSRYEVKLLTKKGEERWVDFTAGAIDFEGKPSVLGTAFDITERKRAEEELRRLNQELEADRKAIEELSRSLEEKVQQRTEELRLANEELRQRHRQLLDARAQAATDALTGLSNHRAFHERIRDEVTRAQENGTSVGLIMLDIDSFKRANDSLGHLAGDEILRELAPTIAGVVRPGDAYRYGGDEFAVLLPGADRRKAIQVAEQLRRAVERQMDGSRKVTVSLGVAVFPDMAASAEELIYGADAAMYWAKSAGKNRVADWSKLIAHRADGTAPWYLTDRCVKAPDAVAALVAALSAKDPVTSEHTERCSWYAARLAEELGLGENDASVVRLAALLHDIGKLAVPDEVLFKPGPLNAEEWATMKQHPTAALYVLSQIRSITDATPAVLHHHEHFDGSGYPDGLAGEEIPIASRILLVTDAFDAMTTDRPYRKAMPVEKAIEELKRCSGSQFDPQVVEAFLKILSRHGAAPLHSMATAQGVR